MQPQIKNVVWFASSEGENCAFSAAQWAMENAGVKMQTCYSAKIPYREGILTRPDGCTIKVYILPLSGKFSEQARAIASNAHAILLSGTCVGRPGAVKLGDVIGVTGCYHIDTGARRGFDGNVEFNISPVFAAEAVRAQLQKIQKNNIEHSHALPVSIETRRDWVLDYLNSANIALPKKEFFPIAPKGSSPKPKMMRWGLRGYFGTGLLLFNLKPPAHNTGGWLFAAEEAVSIPLIGDGKTHTVHVEILAH